MEKQFDEMAKDLTEIFDEEYENRRVITPQNTAEKMTAKGYRKQSEGDIIIPKMSDEDIEKVRNILKKSPLQIIVDDKSEAWISVDERLPKEKPTKWKYQPDYNIQKFQQYCVSEDVLVIAKFNDGEEKPFVSIGSTANGSWVIYYDDDEREYTVTHWMPLPEPPKMKGGAE